MVWVYDQSSGQISHNGNIVGQGYSGRGTSRDNPNDERMPNRGPIPRGRYNIGAPRNSAATGPYVLDLAPDGHNAHGRTDFQIHGNNATNDASEGCIILPRAIRERIGTSGDGLLEVVP